MVKNLLLPEPEVTLINYFDDPYDNAIAAARTCYSSSVVFPEDVKENREKRDIIAKSVYKAGHHTVFQHSSFQFVLKKVSRQFIWSFLHSHQFYNSEQVSQRYVEVKPENFAIPPLDNENLKIYTETIKYQMDIYRKLIDVLESAAKMEYERLFLKNLAALDKKEKSIIKKKQQEVARYVLPVATHANLYHTVNGLTVYRYYRLCQQYDVPLEQFIVINKMAEEIKKIEPLFFNYVDDPLPLEETLEYRVLCRFKNETSMTRQFIKEFDSELQNTTSKLIDYKINTEKSLAGAVRSVLGLTEASLSEKEALDLVLNPSKNYYLCESLNLNTMSKLTRVLAHAHFTFKKKLSHSADSQDQRHRTVLASRPVIHTQFISNHPDYVIPALIKSEPFALELYQEAMQTVWQNMDKLLNNGVDKEYVMYLLPNAFPVRFEESGDLLGLHHKWTKRLCYTVQEELWNNCLDEIKQVKKIFPDIAKHILAPCYLRKNGNIKPYCPEGERFCGKDVWNLELDDYIRTV